MDAIGAAGAKRSGELLPASGICAAILISACLVPLLWPGDIPFINDEPLLISAAVQANAHRLLAPAGLLGTFGFVYGPAPTWVYQLLVSFNHDLVVIAVVHTILIVATTALSLWWLSRSL